MDKNSSTKNLNRKVSSYIFYGSNTEISYTAAKEFADDLGISGFDTIEVEPELKGKNPKGDIGVGAVREMIRQINLTPGHGSGKLAIIKEADKLGIEAANTLLKTLEEPPKTAKIILISANLKLLPTIRSRCQIIRLSDKVTQDDQLVLEEFRKAVGGKLVNAFSAAEKMAIDSDLDRKLEVIISRLRDQLVKNTNISSVKKIKAIITAKKNLGLTTNRRLILENLMMELKYG